jgi:hypothetical protein
MRSSTSFHLPPEPLETLYDDESAGRILGVTRTAVANWRRKGRLPFVTIAGRPRIRESALRGFIVEAPPGSRL